MITHRAQVIKESIESLGLNGMAFSVICCDDPATIERHTIHKAHTLTDEELRTVFDHYTKSAARAHLANCRNKERATQIAGTHPGCEVCG